MIFFIPLSVNFLVEKAAERLTARASGTPLIIGSRENTTELTLSSLYFRVPDFTPVNWELADSLSHNDLNKVIPLNLRHAADGYPIVGTSPEYMEFRGLTFAEGRGMSLVGECVLGSEVANALGVSPGGSIISSPASAFDIAGSFPLKMIVVGILNPNGTSDDQAIFADIKTSWVISGKAHGHQDIRTVEGEKLLGDSSTLVASAAVLSYTEITDDNRNSFHFHGNPAEYPVDAILVVPGSRQESLKLRSAFDQQPLLQALVPLTVVGELIDTLFTVNNLLIIGAISVGVAAFALAVLVFSLSVKLRARELNTLRKMGVSPGRIRGLFFTEIALVLTGSIVTCGLLMTILKSIENNWIDVWII